MWFVNGTYLYEHRYNGLYSPIAPGVIEKIQFNSVTIGWVGVSRGTDFTSTEEVSAGNIDNVWDNDSLLKAPFDKDLKAGRIHYDYDTIGRIIIYRKEKSEYEYTPIDYAENANNGQTLFEGYIYIDRTVQNNKEYDYAISIQGEDNTELTFVEAYWVTKKKISFDGYYIYDGNTEYHGYITMGLSDQRTIERNVVQPLYSKYPYIINNSRANYTTLDIQSQFIQKDNRTVPGLDFENQAFFREQVIDFLTTGKPLLWRNHDGRNRIIMITDAISNSPDSYINAVNTSYSAAEIADAYDRQNLYDFGFINYNPITDREDVG